jgi:hypothetical protein
VAALPPSAPLKLSLDSFTGCSSKLCYRGIESPALVLSLEHR